jgi:hypothetical protein
MVLCKKLNLRIIPIHFLREDPRIKLADNGSKTADTDDWQIDETFLMSNRKFKLKIDLLASDSNTEYGRFFFSNFCCKRTTGIDAFSRNEEVAWICPPIRELIKVTRKLKTSKTTGILFIPEWKTSDYWINKWKNV